MSRTNASHESNDCAHQFNGKKALFGQPNGLLAITAIVVKLKLKFQKCTTSIEFFSEISKHLE
jgi:hypothetical protein